MKKIYIVPKTEVVKMNVNHFLCTSNGGEFGSRQDDDYWDEEY